MLLYQKDQKIQQTENQWWRKFIGNSKISFEFSLKDQKPQTKTKIYVNPFLGSFGVGIINERPKSEPSAWAEVLVSLKRKDDFTSNIKK